MWEPYFIMIKIVFSQFTPMHVSKNLENAPTQVLAQLHHWLKGLEIISSLKFQKCLQSGKTHSKIGTVKYCVEVEISISAKYGCAGILGW